MPHTNPVPLANADVAMERARLIRLQLSLLVCLDSPARQLLSREIDIALAELSDGRIEYSRELRTECESVTTDLRRRSRWGRTGESSIGVVLAGIVLYSFFVLVVLGPCVIVVDSLDSHVENGFTRVANALGLMPLFSTVRNRGIKPEAYIWGIWGGAGAVVSMVKRFDKLASEKSSFWLLFGQGLFNPIVGSLSAVVICAFVYRGNELNILKPIPDIVVAFFAGFSERLLGRVESMLNPPHGEAKPPSPLP